MAGIYDRSMAGLKDVADGLSKIGLTAWLRLIAYTLLIIGIYWSSLKWLIFHDWIREDYSHCYIVPFLLLYLLWEKRQSIIAVPARRSWMGLLPLALALALFWLGELAGELFSIYISLWLAIVGLLWLHLGWPRLKQLTFPLFMILTMFPLPVFLNIKVLNTLKLISSKFGVAILQLYGMPVFREGNVIDLGFTQLQVVDACSGLRYVMPLLVLSLLLAYWFNTSFWKRTILVISSIPLAIAVNGLRIALTGILYSIWGASVAEEFFHGFSSWLIFIGMIPFLLLEIWVLKRLPPRGGETDGRPSHECATGETVTQGVTGKMEACTDRWKMEDRCARKMEDVENEGRGERKTDEQATWLKQLFQPVFVVAILLLASTLALSHTIEFREKIPIRQPLSQFPRVLAQWSGTSEVMDQKFIRELDLSDYTIVNYRDNANKEVNFYVAYYETQRKGESIHSPETCLPGSGWEFREAGRSSVPVALPGMTAMPVNRAYMEKSGAKQLAYYWFPQRGRILTSAYELKLYTFWDSLTKRRTDGALVRVITPLYPGETMKDAEARLQEFTGEVVPVLKGYIPE